MIRVTWTGAAGLVFETGEETFLIDPYYTRVDLFNTLLGPISPDEKAVDAVLSVLPRKITAVIIGHTHSDHALDTPLIIRKSRAKLVGSASLETLMALSGMPGCTTVCRGGETIGLSKNAAVTMLPSAHGKVIMNKVPFEGEIRPSAVLPMKASGYRLGGVFAPKLSLGSTVFLHVGSAGFIARQLEGHTCDVLFLCAAGWTKCEGYPHRLLEITRPRRVVLFHYDDFSKHHSPGSRTRKLPLLDLQGLVSAVRACDPKIQVTIPQIGEPIDFQ